MLDIVNERPLTIDERKSILMRALNATPYFNHASADLAAGVPTNINLFKIRRHVYIDFYVTEVRQNISEMLQVNGFNYNVSIYLANTGVPIYGYNKSQSLPASFIATDTPNNPNFVTRFDDRQRESFPFKIRAGDEVITEIEFDQAVPIATDGIVHSTLIGFQSIQYPYLSSDETERVNRSLAMETVFQTFQIDVPAIDPASAGFKRVFNFDNDVTPRLILGFGVVDNTPNAGEIPQGVNVDIIDSIRHIKLTNEPMPLEVLAARNPVIQDAHIYYLPIEHYFCPFGQIRLALDNFATAIPPELNHDYKIVMLTRTI